VAAGDRSRRSYERLASGGRLQEGLARRNRHQRGASRIKQEGREDRGEVHSNRFPNSPIFLFKILLKLSDSRIQQCQNGEEFS
jgi:hypothetical protein